MTNQHHFLITYTWDALKRECKPNEPSVEQYKDMFEPRTSAGATEKLPGWENLTRKQLRGPTTCKDILKNALKDFANWQTRRRSNCTKFQALAWTIFNSRKRNLNQLENCQKFAHRVSKNACIWHELVNLTFCGQSTNLLDQSPKWTQACNRRLARLISYTHHTRDYRQHRHVRNTAQHCRLGLFQDSDFGGEPTFVPISWMCKKQTSVSHSSTVSTYGIQQM